MVAPACNTICGPTPSSSITGGLDVAKITKTDVQPIVGDAGPQQITFEENEIQGSRVVADAAGDQIVVQDAGIYMVLWTVTGDALTAGQQWRIYPRFDLAILNGSESTSDIQPAGGQDETKTGSVVRQLEAGTSITLTAEHDDDALSRNIEGATLSVVQLRRL